jgi:hypothetical protein
MALSKSQPGSMVLLVIKTEDFVFYQQLAANQHHFGTAALAAFSAGKTSQTHFWRWIIVKLFCNCIPSWSNTSK